MSETKNTLSKSVSDSPPPLSNTLTAPPPWHPVFSEKTEARMSMERRLRAKMAPPVPKMRRVSLPFAINGSSAISSVLIPRAAFLANSESSTVSDAFRTLLA